MNNYEHLAEIEFLKLTINRKNEEIERLKKTLDLVLAQYDAKKNAK